MGFQSAEVIGARDPSPSDLDPTSDDLELDFEVPDDKSLYEEIAKCGVFLTKEEMETCCEMAEVVQPDADPGSDLEEVHVWKVRINEACARLRIQADPHNWSPEDTLRWSLDTLRGLDLPGDPSLVAGLAMHGTTLCMLTEDDFKSRAPEVGESLFTELEIWKNVGNSISTFEAWDNSHNGSIESNPIYLELNTVDLHRYESSLRDDDMTSSDANLRNAYSLAVADAYRLNQELLLGNRNPLFSEVSSKSIRDDRNLVTKSVTNQANHSYAPAQETKPNSPADYKNWGNREKHATHLWQFLKELLNQPSIYENCIRWTDHTNGVFRIEDSSKVARLWGERKHRPAMNYDKLSRSIRQYYKKGIIRKTQQSKRLVYQFCPQYI